MKGGLFSVGLTAFVLILTFGEVSALVCEREVAFGFTQRFSCPQPTDSKDKIYCCGGKENRFCCETPFGLNEDVVNQVIDMSSDSNVTDINIPTTQALKVRKFSKTLPTILTVIGVFILVIIIVCIVCCCCCPFCILHKRRNRGAVHNPNTADVTVTQPLQPMQPVQQPYASPQPYPPQPYPSQPYPPQPQPYPPAQGYPGGYPQQPYPPQAPQPAMYPVDQPPPYSEKQLPYNPNYQQ
ncbi:protein shisa-5-like isoform X4 [Macrobrachium nipponense]|uniref:protein shisa-5-like isoform X4 n=1 Tax=Macrobrachium nipponense TaxID=159736 RepID=UPI0030C88164